LWCARFTDSQIETLKQVIRVQGEFGADLQGALEALELARWDDLPEAQLPWGEVAASAGLQGITEADVIWDLAGRAKEPAVTGPSSVKRQVRRPSKGGTRRPAT
jgi:hypothetical protein